MAAEPGQWSNEAWADADDAELLSLSREGSSEAYAELWRRHLPAAYAVAAKYRGRASSEDIVADASLRVYQLIQQGRGPQTHFRSYFLTTVKTVAVDGVRRELKVVPTEDEQLEVLTGVEEHRYDAVVDQELVRRAFRGLSERDQQVLWHTAVEGRSPSAVSAVMGMSANGVSVTALRAKDTLRAKYLDAHAARAIERADSDECRWVLERMGRYTRGKLPRRQHLRVEDHLAQCAHARALAVEMAEVNRALPAIIVPLIFMAACAGPHVAVATLSAAVLGSAGTVEGATSGGSDKASQSSTVGSAGAIGVAAVALGSAGGAASAGATTAGAAAGALGAVGAVAGKVVAVVMAAGLGASFVASDVGRQALREGPLGDTSVASVTRMPAPVPGSAGQAINTPAHSGSSNPNPATTTASTGSASSVASAPGPTPPASTDAAPPPAPGSTTSTAQPTTARTVLPPPPSTTTTSSTTPATTTTPTSSTTSSTTTTPTSSTTTTTPVQVPDTVRVYGFSGTALAPVLAIGGSAPPQSIAVTFTSSGPAYEAVVGALEQPHASAALPRWTCRPTAGTKITCTNSTSMLIPLATVPLRPAALPTGTTVTVRASYRGTTFFTQVTRPYPGH